MTGDALNDVALVVAVYDPDEAVRGNLRAAAELATVIAVDDGSPRSAVLNQVRQQPGIRWIALASNRGIAAALNAGLQAAVDEGARYLVTLDQDARLGHDDLERLLQHVRAAEPGLALVGPGRVGRWRHPQRGTDVLTPVDEILQSGMSMSAWTFKALGPLDEALVIDGVDTDYCLRALAMGGQVLAAHDVGMQHQLGRGDAAARWRIGPWRPTHTGHSPLRRFYMTRNKLTLVRRYGRQNPRWAGVTLRRLTAGGLLAILLGPQRLAQFAAVAAGVRDALLGRSGRRPGS